MSMRFNKYLPVQELQAYIKYYAVSEKNVADEYTIFPTPGLVIGFQYSGRLSTVDNGSINSLNSAGISGITERYKVFRNSANTGTILVYFTEVGFAQFTLHPANELFNLSTSLDDIFKKNLVDEVEEKLAFAATDKDRIAVVEHFLQAQFRKEQPDPLIVAAVKLIYQSRGTIRIKELNNKLFISQSPFEKRFRKVVGTSPKQFASIVRFNTVLNMLKQTKSPAEICYEHNFFDQAHFIKDFKKFTGYTPERYKSIL